MLEQFLAYFFMQGPFGVLFIGTVLVLGYVVKLWRDEIKDHINDLKHYKDAVNEPLSKLQQTADAIITKNNQTNDILISLLRQQK